jgi:uncharacterized membrane protein YjfL (UPF0719 family)
MVAPGSHSKQQPVPHSLQAIFNLGGVIGGMIVVILNSTNTHNSASDWTYYAIAGLMVVGSFMSFILVARSPREVIRNDNSRVPYNHSYKVCCLANGSGPALSCGF